MTGIAAPFRAMHRGPVEKSLGYASILSAALIAQVLSAEAQTPCLPLPFANPAIEITSTGGVLRGTINLTEQSIPMPQRGDTNCTPRPSQLVRVFQGYPGLIDPPMPPLDQPPPLKPAAPGPTLRAQLGDVVQLGFINQVNQNNFDENLDIETCTALGENGSTYPNGAGDASPNCLHASSTSNIHFHGTHTSPKSTADNVYLMIRPLPRDRLGKPTTPVAELTQSFGDWFDLCAKVLKDDPLRQWPSNWNDLPEQYVKAQISLLQQYQAENPQQPIWDADYNALQQPGVWPQYYIGAYPYCFALPEYKSQTWPPPPGSPRMGQSPGTHWYHAHKHGSTAINVGNGMVGAFIIEGPSYDGALNAFYGRYQVDGQAWSSRNQNVMVINQLQTVPNRLTNTRGGTDFVINGVRQPQVTMRPGEVQLWRIVNGAGINAAFFQAPKGLQWRQIAQDGVQFANQNYLASENQAIYVAPGNRIDLLVKAPDTAQPAGDAPFEVRVQKVTARGAVKPIPLTAGETDPTVVLMTVTVTGNAVTPEPMPFIPEAPQQPAFLADITDQELSPPDPKVNAKTLNFNSLKSFNPQTDTSPRPQHTINGQQFSDQGNNALVTVQQLNVAEQWLISNSTTLAPGPGLIDHPFHIHINPFQITDVFDPNQNIINPNTGEPVGIVVDGKTVPIPLYVVAPAPKTDPRQCVLEPNDPSTWTACPPTPSGTLSKLIWWDVFAIPSGRVAAGAPNNVIPGYFKMRSRFVDYPGLYVLHCHMLIHEDRGMMFRVNVGNDPSVAFLKHH